jgi:hypothetical protein
MTSATIYRGDYHRFCSKLPIIYPYFEASTIGFVRRGLELKAGRKVEMKLLSGFERGKTLSAPAHVTQLAASNARCSNTPRKIFG